MSVYEQAQLYRATWLTSHLCSENGLLACLETTADGFLCAGVAGSLLSLKGEVISSYLALGCRPIPLVQDGNGFLGNSGQVDVLQHRVANKTRGHQMLDEIPERWYSTVLRPGRSIGHLHQRGWENRGLVTGRMISPRNPPKVNRID